MATQLITHYRRAISSTNDASSDALPADEHADAAALSARGRGAPAPRRSER
jgi:hypothetical protein